MMRIQLPTCSAGSLTLRTAILFGIIAQALAQNSEGPIKNYADLVATADRLLSINLTAVRWSKAAEHDRTRSVYRFVREPKSTLVNKHYAEVVDVAKDYRDKAYAYIEDVSNRDGSANGGWFVNFLRAKPLDILKGVAKFDPFLQSRANSYEKDKRLSNDVVDCDIIKFQVIHLQAILYVLVTDFSALLHEPLALINRAIYDKLKASQFVSPNNFYEITSLTAVQKRLLLEYIALKHENTQLGRWVDHVSNPGEFVIGRLTDDCQTLSLMEPILNTLEQSYDETCAGPETDASGTNQFKSQNPFGAYKRVADLCQRYLDGFAPI